MNRRAVTIALFAVTLMAQVWAGRASADDCQKPTNVSFAPGKLTTDRDHAGQIAWLPGGKTSASFHSIDGCIFISGSTRPQLYFAIGNSIEAHEEKEKATFILVQVIRFQSQLIPNVPRLRISRFGQWERDQKPVKLIDDQPLNALTISQFLSIHEKKSLDAADESQVQFNGNPWHARPIDGIYSSIESANRFSSPELRKYAEDPMTVFSNWLFPVSTSKPALTWFYVNTSGTQKFVIRTFSPNRPQFDKLVEVQVNIASPIRVADN